MNDEELRNWLSREDVQRAYAPVKKLQDVLLGMLSDFDKLCAKNGLRYYLFYGTLLGAVRHGGFIPWDDDADVVMPRGDYEKLLRLPKEMLPSAYFIQSPYSEKYGRFAFAKFRKDGTTCIAPAHKHIPMHHGIYIDIFPMDETTTGCGWLMWYLPRFFERLTAFSCANLPSKLRFLRPLQKLWMRLFPASIFARIGNAVARSLSGHSGVYMNTFCTIRSKVDRRGWNASLFGEGRRIHFDGVLLSSPDKSKKVLELLYGKWDELPSEKSRYPIHSDGGIIDTCRDYKEYLHEHRT